MQTKIKQSVAVLLAYVIKKENRDLAKEAPLFCSMLGSDFACSHDEAMELLKQGLNSDFNIDEHIGVINEACKKDLISKMHILEQINHLIYADKISENDYEEFEYIKNKLFECKK
jgi:hypothetical protein